MRVNKALNKARGKMKNNVRLAHRAAYLILIRATNPSVFFRA